MIKVTMQFVKEFHRVEKAQKDAERRYLYRVGGLMRRHVTQRVLGPRKAKRRKRKSGGGYIGAGPSRPGQPPIPRRGGKNGKADIKRVRFHVDSARGFVIIGPTGGVSDAPELLEKGGRSTRRVRGRRMTVRHPKRPYMRVSFDLLKPTFASIYGEESRRIYRRGR